MSLWGESGTAGAVDQADVYSPVHGLQRIARDLAIVRVLPDGYAALGGVVAFMPGEAAEHDRQLFPGDGIIRAEQSAAIAFCDTLSLIHIFFEKIFSSSENAAIFVEVEPKFRQRILFAICASSLYFSFTHYLLYVREHRSPPEP